MIMNKEKTKSKLDGGNDGYLYMLREQKKQWSFLQKTPKHKRVEEGTWRFLPSGQSLFHVTTSSHLLLHQYSIGNGQVQTLEIPQSFDCTGKSSSSMLRKK